MGWIATGYHFVSALVNCSVSHSTEVAKTALDLVTCVTGMLFK